MLFLFFVIFFIFVVTSIISGLGDKVGGSIRKSYYEECFERRIGQTPQEYIVSKLKNGSNIEAIRYAYELTATGIEREYNCQSESFDFYLERLELDKVVVNTANVRNQEIPQKSEYVTKEEQVAVLAKEQTREQSQVQSKDKLKGQPKEQSKEQLIEHLKEHLKEQAKAQSDMHTGESQNSSQSVEKYIQICEKELLFKKYFLETYSSQLAALTQNQQVMRNVSEISQIFSQFEFGDQCTNKGFIYFKRTTLPNEFRNRNLMKNVDVTRICSDVESRGNSNVSAIISIYYALRRTMLMS